MDDTNSDDFETSDTPFSNVPIEITISVGTARPLMKELLGLNEETVLSLDRTLDDHVDLLVGNKLIGKGQLEEVEGEGSGKLGVRVIEIAKINSEG